MTHLFYCFSPLSPRQYTTQGDICARLPYKDGLLHGKGWLRGGRKSLMLANVEQALVDVAMSLGDEIDAHICWNKGAVSQILLSKEDVFILAESESQVRVGSK